VSNAKNQNPIYIATTISVYLGLVLVGASPQLLAQTGYSGDSHSRILELTSKTNRVLSDLEQKEDSSIDEIGIACGVASVTVSKFVASGSFDDRVLAPVDQTLQFSNDQVLTVSVLPRASV
jgi:hypothetical protein